ncbi:hypothetical protein T10_1471 [Trichinella papuae]|uniref:Uncharacterized protein n=1 Tax=Trichinella papuae TaxID=268474 RepID=A0A0V1NAW2_9BILA|nr:hypothetical protein T10_1471 [Trichinella papuae]
MEFNLAWLAQSVEHGTLNPRVVGSSPTSGVFLLSLNLWYFTACSFLNSRHHLYKTKTNITYAKS